MPEKKIIIGNKEITLYSNDGINFSMKQDDLPKMEEASQNITPETPFWDIPKEEKK